MSFINKKIRKVLNNIGFTIINKMVKDKSFSVITNDCYGGEIYKALRIPFNTPFIGLMLMGPCYIKFLRNPKYYLTLELEFIECSVYENCNKIRAEKYYPLGKLDDIEIHFLHYNDIRSACEKWNARKKRINWDNLRVCYTVDKDYSTEKELAAFYQLNYKNVVTFSKNDYLKYPNNFKIKKYSTNALVLFRESLDIYNFPRWLNKGNGQLKSMKDKIRVGILKHTINL